MQANCPVKIGKKLERVSPSCSDEKDMKSLICLALVEWLKHKCLFGQEHFYEIQSLVCITECISWNISSKSLQNQDQTCNCLRFVCLFYSNSIKLISLNPHQSIFPSMRCWASIRLNQTVATPGRLLWTWSCKSVFYSFEFVILRNCTGINNENFFVVFKTSL